jgi:hypothetical protein
MSPYECLHLPLSHRGEILPQQEFYREQGQEIYRDLQGQEFYMEQGLDVPLPPLISGNYLAMMFFMPGARLGWIFCLHARGQVRLDIFSSCQGPG